ncbi:hypothetical protein PGTUg99_028610 [Puccinia graminis f. sp. tritici]|uniref:Uncharacterized protein n=1 Tax=Puccinia graminis f. sp. tritici TaxID=56615 RepID=A0A5B0RYM1_PUCGR|nr:hypothetical protein PGTUg99_028610 [Puccinia graminis f. sp. tritici]
MTESAGKYPALAISTLRLTRVGLGFVWPSTIVVDRHRKSFLQPDRSQEQQLKTGGASCSMMLARDKFLQEEFKVVCNHINPMLDGLISHHHIIPNNLR